ncbi:hypothetical protein [Mucilaginibacter sp. L3T2-6]|uniref:hypothetical protein n=1 Tax=Mucilaginibacter sp. L3T2-6 TaxID=3062491 RepID=UPI002674696D|nr:hypothetical protein [Mucilaginibacter sp. L3T2-6]MDO3640969.1 hypothetical protein [Mucilaginibacter sp. L3T2-6]MDV6213555.1 hypothetical protein [Mucilaginibacter sp. L3T2-6]
MKKLLMSAIVLIVFSFAIILFQISCKKGALADTKTLPTIKGLWVGSYTVDDQPGWGEQYFSLIIKPDGTMVTDSKGAGQQHLAPGTWTLNNDTLKCDFTCVYGITSNIGIRETTIAVVDKNTGELRGKWKNAAAPVDSGKFILTKVN